MASAIFFTILKNSHNLTVNAVLTMAKTYSEGRYVSRNLFARIAPLGDPTLSLAPVLDQWVGEGKNLKQHELQGIIRDLRARKRYNQALEVSEWMSSKGHYQVSASDHAVHLDLIGRVRGLETAEEYFNKIGDNNKINKIYGALLNCYVREGLVDKSLSHMQKMKEMGFLSCPLSYNDLMCLYTNTGQLEKVPYVLSEMKEDGVSPDNFSYRICINSYGARSDLKNMENVLREMESQPHISMEWTTYSTAANFFIKASSKEKALIYLKKCEGLVHKDSLGYNHLISHYASLGNKDEMMRLWALAKSKCKKQNNRDYITMLGSLVKIRELDEAEKLLKEWESSCLCYDFRVPNVVLIGYCQQGLVEKAEEMLWGIIEKGKTPTPNSWAIVAVGYMEKGNMEKACKNMKFAFSVLEENKRWRPKHMVISRVLGWLGDNGDVEEVEAFVNSVKTKFSANRDMYHALIKAYIRSGREVNQLLDDMKANGIDDDEGTEKILSSR